VESPGFREDGENDEKKTDQNPGCTNLTLAHDRFPCDGSHSLPSPVR